MPHQLPKISIIGAGAVGTAISSYLFDKGYRFSSVIDMNGTKALSLANLLKCNKVGVVVNDISLDTDIVMITVNDNSISSVAMELAKNKKIYHKKLFAVHCSGVYSSDILAPLRKKGSLTASMHPLQTFPQNQKLSRIKSKLKGIYYGIEGSPESLRIVKNIIEALDGKSIIISKEMKPLYHIASVFASNYLTVLLNTISDLTSQLKQKESWMEIFGPIMTTTMENVIKMNAPKALTGPIVRGDLRTLDIHLDSLYKHTPQFIPLYTIAGIEAARIAKDNNRITDEDFKKIILKFRKFIQSNSFNKIKKVKH